MRRTISIGFLCVALIISAGCVNQGLPGSDPGNPGTPTSTAVCNPEYPDGVIHNCFIEERPPDLEVTNYHGVHHNVSIRITEDETTVVLSEDMSLDPHESVVLEDVVTAPGIYNLTVSSNNATAESALLDVEKRYNRDGGVYRNIWITDDGDIEILGTGPA